MRNRADDNPAPRTDPERDRPWDSGPWQLHARTDSTFTVGAEEPATEESSACWWQAAEVTGQANAQLVALVPQLAEAILAWQELELLAVWSDGTLRQRCADSALPAELWASNRTCTKQEPCVACAEVAQARQRFIGLADGLHEQLMAVRRRPNDPNQGTVRPAGLATPSVRFAARGGTGEHEKPLEELTRPWDPGPWQALDDGWQRGHWEIFSADVDECGCGDEPIARLHGVAHAGLLALAPQLAEVILARAEYQDLNTDLPPCLEADTGACGLLLPDGSYDRCANCAQVDEAWQRWTGMAKIVGGQLARIRNPGAWAGERLAPATERIHARRERLVREAQQRERERIRRARRTVGDWLRD